MILKCHLRSSNVVPVESWYLRVAISGLYNFRRITFTYRFRDTSCFNAKNHILPTHLYLTLNLKLMPLECGDEIWRQKTRIMGLLYGEEIVEPRGHSPRV